MGGPLINEVHAPSFERTPSARASDPRGWFPALTTHPSATSTSSVGTQTQSSTFVANCPAYAVVGCLVYISGASAVDLADGNAPNVCVGVIIVKETNSRAVVQTSGVASVFNNLQPGQPYALGHAGQLVYPPIATDITYAQRIGVAISPTALMLTLGGSMTRRNAS